MKIVFLIIEILLLCFVFLLVSRKEEGSLAINNKVQVKKISMILFLFFLIFGFYLDKTFGLVLVLVNSLYASLIAFYPKRTIVLALMLLVPITLFYF